MHGVEVFRKNLEEKLQIVSWIKQQLNATDGMEVSHEPVLTALCFRLTKLPKGSKEVDDKDKESELEKINQSLMQQINARNRVMINTTRLRGKLVLRICIL